jgi:hypothetical protein
LITKAYPYIQWLGYDFGNAVLNNEGALIIGLRAE